MPSSWHARRRPSIDGEITRHCHDDTMTKRRGNERARAILNALSVFAPAGQAQAASLPISSSTGHAPTSRAEGRLRRRGGRSSAAAARRAGQQQVGRRRCVGRAAAKMEGPVAAAWRADRNTAQRAETVVEAPLIFAAATPCRRAFRRPRTRARLKAVAPPAAKERPPRQAARHDAPPAHARAAAAARRRHAASFHAARATPPRAQVLMMASGCTPAPARPNGPDERGGPRPPARQRRPWRASAAERRRRSDAAVSSRDDARRDDAAAAFAPRLRSR